MEQERRETKALLEWYREARRTLPWRHTADPYRVWLSEVMLQQTRVETVIPYYDRFLERFPALNDLARARQEEVLALWSGLGYYRRARSLLEGARYVVSRFDGNFPASLDDALTIPGIGPYTAAAILSIAYGLPYPVLDGNVERVLTRFLRLRGNPRQARVARQLKRFAGSWLPHGDPGDFNQALMELGATVCTPKAPGCPCCPLAQGCQARLHGNPERYPELPAARRTVNMKLEVGLFKTRGRYLMEQPLDLGFLRGVWVFPLAESPSTDTNGDGICEALSRKLGVHVDIRGDLPPVRHSITYRRIVFEPKLLGIRPANPRLPESFRWARVRDFGKQVPVSSMCIKIREDA